MTTRTNVEVIPAKTFTTTIYVADDGKEFYHEDDCLRHEAWVRVMQHPVFANRIDDVETLDGFSSTLYYLSSKEDLDFFIDKSQLHRHCFCDYNEHGPGWYMYYCVSGGDYADEHYLINYNNYESEKIAELNQWKDKMQSLMKSYGGRR